MGLSEDIDHNPPYVLYRRHLISAFQKIWKDLDYVTGNVRTSIWLVNDAMGPFTFIMKLHTIEDQGQYFDAPASHSN